MTRRTIKALAAVGLAGVVGSWAVGLGGVSAAESVVAHRWAHVESSRTPAAAVAAESRRADIVLHELFGPLFTFVDVGEEGASPGDYGVFQDVVADPRTHKPLGVIDVQCVEAYASHCRGSISLRGRGQIVFDGATPTTVDPDRFAITGGTGKFRGVGGELVVSFPSDDFAVLTLHLVRPHD